MYDFLIQISDFSAKNVQIALLIMENKAQKKLFQQKDKVPSPSPQSDGKDTKESVLPKAELSAATSPNECKEEKMKFSSITNVVRDLFGLMLIVIHESYVFLVISVF